MILSSMVCVCGGESGAFVSISVFCVLYILGFPRKGRKENSLPPASLENGCRPVLSQESWWAVLTATSSSRPSYKEAVGSYLHLGEKLSERPTALALHVLPLSQPSRQQRVREGPRASWL